jgi:methionyl-tRNA formyltransferase
MPLRVLPVVGLKWGYSLFRQLIASPLCEIPHAVILAEDPHEREVWSDQMATMAAEANLPCTVAAEVSAVAWRSIIQQYQPDVLFIMGWRRKIPLSVLEGVPHGALNLHASMLPDLRGFAPYAWSILLGRETFGMTLFRIVDEIDAGPILVQRRLEVGPRPKVGPVLETIAAEAPGLFLAYLAEAQGTIPEGMIQDHSKATFGHKRVPADGVIDWSMDAESIDRVVRSVGYPLPGAYTWMGGQRLVIWDGEPVPEPTPLAGRVPGAVLAVNRKEGYVDVVTGKGLFRVTQVSSEGGPAAEATAVINSLTHRLGGQRS